MLNKICLSLSLSESESKGKLDTTGDGSFEL